MDVRTVSLGFNQVTLDAITAVGLDQGLVGGIPEGANAAYIEVEGSTPIRWRNDGPAPTASVGMALLTPNGPWCCTAGIRSMLVISTSGPVVIDVTFCKIVG